MDAKDLELITELSEHGRWDPVSLSSQLGISPGNVQRRIRLLVKDGVIAGFSAFIDRRAFGFDTTFVRLHFSMRSMDKVLEGVGKMPQVAMVYPNMDEYLIAEVAHWDRDSLSSAIKAMERIAKPYTVTAHYVPLLPDAVPERPKSKDLELVKLLIRKGRAKAENLGEMLSLDTEDVEERIRRMEMNQLIKIRPLVREELVQPFPTFSILVFFEKGCEVTGCISSIQTITKETWDRKVLEKPIGAWIKCFGKDLHAMDMMLERFRRLDYVKDVQVILPDSIIYNRRVDLDIVSRKGG